MLVNYDVVKLATFRDPTVLCNQYLSHSIYSFKSQRYSHVLNNTIQYSSYPSIYNATVTLELRIITQTFQVLCYFQRKLGKKIYNLGLHFFFTCRHSVIAEFLGKALLCYNANTLSVGI